MQGRSAGLPGFDDVRGLITGDMYVYQFSEFSQVLCVFVVQGMGLGFLLVFVWDHKLLVYFHTMVDEILTPFSNALCLIQ